jgi:hypothetical protein
MHLVQWFYAEKYADYTQRVLGPISISGTLI